MKQPTQRANRERSNRIKGRRGRGGYIYSADWKGKNSRRPAPPSSAKHPVAKMGHNKVKGLENKLPELIAKFGCHK